MTITKNHLLVPGVVAIAAIVGVAAGNSLNATGASAATTSTTQSAASDPADTPDKGGHVGDNGTKEEVLSGDNAAKAKAAAEAAVPGGTVLRAENDAEDATYEVHVKKSDGSTVTVKLDSNFKVTATESGMGPGSHDQQGQNDTAD
jgi:hypothetical protein